MHLLAWTRHERGGYASTPEVREAVEMNHTTVRIFDKISSCTSSTLFYFILVEQREKADGWRNAGTGDMES